MLNQNEMMNREFVINALNELNSYIPENNYMLNHCLIVWKSPLTGKLEKRFILSTADEVIDWKNKNKENYQNVEHSIYINGNLSY